jgi:hypothetical protein
MSMTAEELGLFNSRRQNARDQYSQYLTQSTYNKGLAAQDYTSHLQRAGQTFDNQRQNLPDAYLRRGILNSGLYGQGLTQFNQNRQQGLGDITQAYERNASQGNINDQNQASTMNNALSQIDQEEAARRADIAASLKGLY